MQKSAPIKYKHISGKITDTDEIKLYDLYQSHINRAEAVAMNLLAVANGQHFLFAFVPKKHSQTGKEEMVGFVRFTVDKQRKLMATNRTWIKPEFRRQKIGQKMNLHLWGIARNHRIELKKPNQMPEMVNMIRGHLSKRMHYGKQEKAGYSKGVRSTQKSEIVSMRSTGDGVHDAFFKPPPKRKRPFRPL